MRMVTFAVTKNDVARSCAGTLEATTHLTGILPTIVIPWILQASVDAEMVLVTAYKLPRRIATGDPPWMSVAPDERTLSTEVMHTDAGGTDMVIGMKRADSCSMMDSPTAEGCVAIGVGVALEMMQAMRITGLTVPSSSLVARPLVSGADGRLVESLARAKRMRAVA